MDANYEHIAIYTLIGGSSAIDGAASALPLVDTKDYSIVLTSNLADAVVPLARSESIRDRFFAAGLPRDAAELEAVAAAFVAQLRRQQGTFLVCTRRGTVPLRPIGGSRDYRPAADLQVLYDEGGARSDIALANATANVLGVHLVCSKLAATARKVREGVRFLSNGCEIVPVTVSIGSMSLTVSHLIEPESVETLRGLLPRVAALPVSSDAAVLQGRFEAFEAGAEPLASMGMFCLTLLEVRAGGRPAAARRYSISSRC